MSKEYQDREDCPYCEGQGYFHLILGGTENCPNCHGAGKHDSKRSQVAVGAGSK